MKTKRFARSAVAIALAAGLFCTAALPAGAAASTAQPAKEEIIYANLTADGTLKDAYIVNHFEATAGDTITDYGDYSAVRNMTTTDEVSYTNGVATITPAQDGKLYYEGVLADPVLPWQVEIHYFIDGRELTAEQLAGRSGGLLIRINVAKNPDYDGSYFDEYALQTTITLDTALASNIRADGATMASVGTDKQIMFTFLPGQEIEVEVAADVTDFEMPAIALNGVKLQLKLQIDGVDLDNKLNQLNTGAGQLDTGAQALDLGIQQIQTALDMLNSQGPTITGGSAQVRGALLQLQSALNGVSASTDQLQLLLDASSQISAGIDTLSQQVSFDGYKAILAENGLDLNILIDGNAAAAEQLANIAKYLPCSLGDQLDQIVLLLQGNNANITAMQMYLDRINSGISVLSENYGTFDAGVQQLGTAMTGMLQNVAVLTDAVNTLADLYGTLDDGLNAYTGAIGQILSGTELLSAGSASLVAGTQQFYAETGNLQEDEQLSGLLNTLSGQSTQVSFASAENGEVDAAQFVIQTEPIAISSAAADAAVEEEAELTFWQKLLKLFGLYE